MTVLSDKSVRATRFDQLAENGTARFQFVLEAEHRQGDGAGLGTCKTYYTDSSAARRTGNGDDGVV